MCMSDTRNCFFWPQQKVKNDFVNQLLLDDLLVKVPSYIYSHLQKILEKLRKLRKSCDHKRNINIIYNEKRHYKCLQQLPNSRLRKLGNSPGKKWKVQTAWLSFLPRSPGLQILTALKKGPLACVEKGSFWS